MSQVNVSETKSRIDQSSNMWCSAGNRPKPHANQLSLKFPQLLHFGPIKGYNPDAKINRFARAVDKQYTITAVTILNKSYLYNSSDLRSSACVQGALIPKVTMICLNALHTRTEEELTS